MNVTTVETSGRGPGGDNKGWAGAGGQADAGGRREQPMPGEDWRDNSRRLAAAEAAGAGPGAGE